jgi:hypothetical protein
MDVTDLIAPWLTLLLILLPLVYAEQWIHRHMFGIGYLLTLDKAQATGFYYIIFFPGVLLHEIIQWLVAGALNVKVKKINPYPKTQENGTIRYDFVVIEKTTRLNAMLIGGLPFVIAGAIVYYISTEILQLDALLVAFGTGDLREIGQGITDLLSTGDVWLWLYLLFTVSNGMIPTKEDRQGWLLILGAGFAITIAFVFLGFNVFVEETLSGPVAHALELVSTALSAILFIDVAFILFLGLVEDALERYRGQKMDYNAGRQFTKKGEQPREPGSNIPLPKGTLLPSVYQIDLPVPPIPAKRTPKPQPATPAAPSFSARPAPSSPPTFNRPATTMTETPVVGSKSAEDTSPLRSTGTFTRPASTPPEKSTGEMPASERPLRSPLAAPENKPAETAPASPSQPERPAFPARPSSPSSPAMPPARPALSSDPARQTGSAVSPFRRSGADESESPAPTGRPTFSPPAPRRPPGVRDDDAEADNQNESPRFMGRRPPASDATDEVQYEDVDD